MSYEQDTKSNILDTLSDAVSDFLYYDRKESEWLPLGVIEAAVASGEVTIAEMVARFEKELREGLGKP